MKSPVMSLLAFSVLTGGCMAQMVIPGMPGKFKPRAIGGGTSGGAAVIPKENPKVRYTNYITLSVSRLWTSTEGKLVEGKLIAFEDMIVEGIQGAPPPTAPEVPKYPTVTREEKIRLLINRKPVKLPLSRLSRGDQEFVAQVKAAYAKKSP